MGSVLRRVDLPPAAAQLVVIVAGLGTGVLCALAFLGPGSASTDGVLSAPLFVYGLLVGTLVPGAVELLRLLRVQLPTLPFGLRRRTVELDLAILAAVGAVGLIVIGYDGAFGLVIGVAGTVALLLGTTSGQPRGGSEQPSAPPPGPAGWVRG
jgi:hypothetical protein